MNKILIIYILLAINLVYGNIILPSINTSNVNPGLAIAMIVVYSILIGLSIISVIICVCCIIWR